MNCPQCGARSIVRKTEPTADGGRRRRRICNNGHRFTTWSSRDYPTVESTLGRRKNPPEPPRRG
ncbi:MAG: hypothetical protein GTO22_06710 [Gemmatimonadales bacterium]|nr:hypothetical protein [Gemmatimonadales bacterium]